MNYIVTKQFQHNKENEVAKFNDLSSAQNYVKEQLISDQSMRVFAVYRIKDWLETTLEEFDAKKIDPILEKDTGSSQHGTRFNPTPLNTQPRPAGMPQSGFSDSNKSDK